MNPLFRPSRGIPCAPLFHRIRHGGLRQPDQGHGVGDRACRFAARRALCFTGRAAQRRSRSPIRGACSPFLVWSFRCRTSSNSPSLPTCRISPAPCAAAFFVIRGRAFVPHTSVRVCCSGPWSKTGDLPMRIQFCRRYQPWPSPPAFFKASPCKCGSSLANCFVAHVFANPETSHAAILYIQFRLRQRLDRCRDFRFSCFGSLPCWLIIAACSTIKPIVQDMFCIYGRPH